MRTKNRMRHLAWGVLGLVTQQAFTQASIPNNGGGAGAFLGWNAGAGQILEVKNEANERIEWYTDDRLRMLLNETVTYGLLGSFPSIPADGFELITPSTLFLQSGAKGPFSRLHLAEGVGDNNQAIGYRPWQRNGITFTGNADHGYIGQKYWNEEETDDYTDMVVQWSDNPGFEKADRMRFIFTSAYDPLQSTGMNSEEGLEAMRMWPTHTDGVNIGVGDFFAVGEDPSERFDVLDGKVRIRELPTQSAATTLDMYMVVANDGIVNWRNLPADCEWTMTTGANRHVFTAVGPADPNCPDDMDAVGIGVDPSMALPVTNPVALAAKFRIRAVNAYQSGMRMDVSNASGLSFGLQTDVTGFGQSVRGVQAATHGTCNVSKAGEFISFDVAQYTHGVHGQAYGGTSNGFATGVEGNATSPGINYGVRGSASGGTTNWAGYFNGNTHIQGVATCITNMWGSDASIKTDVQDVGNAMETIVQLQPKTYRFTSESRPELNLPTGLQRGLIAQEVAAILPDVVSDIVIAPVLDSSGTVVYAGETIKGINYIALIPMLIAGIQEQQQTITEQNQRLSIMEDQLSTCCASNMTGATDRSDNPGTGLNSELSDPDNDRKLRIVPNPFETHTMVYYELERSGRMQLLANSSDGKELRVLHEANLEAGNYQFEWATGDLAPGMYYVTLLLDGQPVTKRAVKIAR